MSHHEEIFLMIPRSLLRGAFNLPMKRAASGRHVFEANVNLFALILQVHGTKPLDDLAQQASIRQR